MVTFSLVDTSDPNGSPWSVLITWEWDGNKYTPIDTVVMKEKTLQNLADEITEHYRDVESE